MDFYYSSIKFVFSKYQTFVNTNAYTIYNDENDWIYNGESGSNPKTLTLVQFCFWLADRKFSANQST